MDLNCRVIAFGSPKAGNDDFEGSVYATVGRVYRVVNSNDAVRFRYHLWMAITFLCFTIEQ